MPELPSAKRQRYPALGLPLQCSIMLPAALCSSHPVVAHHTYLPLQASMPELPLAKRQHHLPDPVAVLGAAACSSILRLRT